MYMNLNERSYFITFDVLCELIALLPLSRAQCELYSQAGLLKHIKERVATEREAELQNRCEAE